MSGRAGYARWISVLAAALSLAVTMGQVGQSAALVVAPYQDPARPVAARVRDLLGRMSLAEKVGQMTQISVRDLVGNCQGTLGAPQPNPGCLRSFLGGSLVGSVLSGGGQDPIPNTPRAWATLTNAIQAYALTRTRLHIPILYAADAVHGHNNVLGATIFPHNLGMAATWDPALVEAEEHSSAIRVLATGIHWTFAPDADLARDLRWGRYYETFGEDPYLAAQLVGAAVRGFQGRNFSTRVTATAKHFLGYSQPLTGADRAFGELSPRALREDVAPSFQAAINNGVGAIMAQSGSINGVPVHASHYLLTDLLRGQMGFTGVLVSDWQDIQALYGTYHVAATYKDAIRQAVNAGIDMSMVPYDAASFVTNLMALVREGQVSRAQVDQAVGRILALKFTLGLFEHPYVDANRAARVVTGSDRGLARQAADETMTVLKNDGGLLPLARSAPSVVVAGPAATSVADQMGGWTINWQGLQAGDNPPVVTVLQGIKEAVGRNTRVTYIADDPAAAARAARSASVAVVVVGEPPYAEGLGDTQTAMLSSGQQALARAVEATGTPTVLIILAGRPLMISALVSSARAVLMAYLPGTEGGHAVGDVLFGTYNPSGRLPVSWPRTIGQVPLFYTFLPGATSGVGGSYDPLFAFGDGQSYTTFAETNLRVDSPVSRSGTARVSVNVRNTGARGGDDVVQLYVHPQDQTIVVPPRRLVAFARVHLRAGQTALVSLLLPATRLAHTTGDVLGAGAPVVTPGRYTLLSGGTSTVLTVR